MHNIVSYNQLAGWQQSINSLNHSLDNMSDESDLLNDYYNCIIECNDDWGTCKKICRRILE
jgi:hypothetical protein